MCECSDSFDYFQVADDPETLRMKQNSRIISNVAYHGDLEKKAAMEKQREVAEIADNRGNVFFFFLNHHRMKHQLGSKCNENQSNFVVAYHFYSLAAHCLNNN